MMNVFYSSTNGKRDGRASRFYKNQAVAQGCVDKQNGKAEHLQISTRYELTTTTDKDVDAKDIT